MGGDNAVWDGFHKLNTAGSDATKQFAMFQKFIDVFKQQEYMSAMGQGKGLRIGFAEYLGKRDLRHKAICGHRKTCCISGVTSRWLQNFKLDYDMYNLNMRRALDGRGKKSFGHFKQAGEAFAAPNLVVFALGVRCGFEGIVQPGNKHSQDTGDLPKERRVAWRKCADDLRAVVK